MRTSSDAAASYAPIAEALCMAFKVAGIPEMKLPVKNTFINFDNPTLLSSMGLMRSVSCPQLLPGRCSAHGGSAGSRVDAPCHRKGTPQILCHAEAPKKGIHAEGIIFAPGHFVRCSAKAINTAMQDEINSSETSGFATPASSPRCFCSAVSQASCTPRLSVTGSLEDGTQSVESAEWTHEPSARKASKLQRAPHRACGGAQGRQATTVAPGCSNRAGFFEKHDVGIEDDNAFHVVQRLLGPDGENLEHIADESNGAKVWICGQGSRPTEAASVGDSGPLQICISATCRSSFREASALVKDLLQATHEDCDRFRSRCSSAAGAAPEGNSGTMSRSFQVGIEVDSTFPIVKKLVGKSGKNMKRIEEQFGGVSVQVAGRRSVQQAKSEGPLEVHVSASTCQSFDGAAVLVMALLTRVHADYREFCLDSNR